MSKGAQQSRGPNIILKKSPKHRELSHGWREAELPHAARMARGATLERSLQEGGFPEDLTSKPTLKEE